MVGRNGPNAVVGGFFGALGLLFLAGSLLGVGSHSWFSLWGIPLWVRLGLVLMGVGSLVLSVRANLRPEEAES